MKELASGPGGAAWNSDLVKQLSFIKKHLRYPLGRRTARPVLLLAGMLPAMAFMIYTLVSTKANSSYGRAWLPVVVISLILLTGIVITRRFLKTLRFIAIPAGRSVGENMLLMQQFLQDHHFAIGRHPHMPEVFQIISQNIPSLKDAREVIIFIADEKRILINSHFTQGRFNTPVGTQHYKQMAGMLAEFIRQQAQYAGAKMTVRADYP